MADIVAIRTRLATLAATVTDVRGYATAEPSVDPGQGLAVIITPGPSYLTPATLDGAQDIRMNAIVVTNAASERSAQTRLDQGVTALVSAFTSGVTADWDYVEPDPPTGYGQYTFGAGDNALTYYGFTMPLLVATSS